MGKKTEEHVEEQDHLQIHVSRERGCLETLVPATSEVQYRTTAHLPTVKQDVARARECLETLCTNAATLENQLDQDRVA